MNFHPFPAVNYNSDTLFWQIVLPVMAVVVPWAMWGEILRMVRVLGRARLLNRVDQRQNAKAQAARRREQKVRRDMSLNDQMPEKGAPTKVDKTATA